MIKGPFEVQLFPEVVEKQFIKNNMTIDFTFGHRSIIKKFVQKNIEYHTHYDWLKSLSIELLNTELLKAKKNSLLITLMMLSGNCNANCGLCCTDRKLNPKGLKSHEIIEILNQVSAFGCKTIYIPGEGEPFFDPALFDLLQECKRLKMSVVVFTNGTILCNDYLSKLYWNMTSYEFLERLKQYPIYIYHKLWSMNPDLIGEMMGIDPMVYEYVRYQNNSHSGYFPKSLDLLLSVFPKERVGIETMIERRNYFEFYNSIIPFVIDNKLYSFFEPIVHAGRGYKTYEYDLTLEESQNIQKYLNRITCKRLGYSMAIHNTGYASFGIIFNPPFFLSPQDAESLNIRCNQNNEIRDLFDLLHSQSLLVNGRYQIDKCLCEKACIHFSKGGSASDLFSN